MRATDDSLIIASGVCRYGLKLCFHACSKLEEKHQQLDQAMDESRQNQKEYEETRRQIEEDADREILDIKNKYERRLRDEKESNNRLKSETGILKKKVRHQASATSDTTRTLTYIILTHI